MNFECNLHKFDGFIVSGLCSSKKVRSVAIEHTFAIKRLTYFQEKKTKFHATEQAEKSAHEKVYNAWMCMNDFDLAYGFALISFLLFSINKF